MARAKRRNIVENEVEKEIGTMENLQPLETKTMEAFTAGNLKQMFDDSFDVSQHTIKAPTKDGGEVEVIKEVIKFVEPIGTRTEIAVMDVEMLRAIDTINKAIHARNMSNYVICKQFDIVNKSGKLESMGFKNIGEFGKAVFGLESSTVNHYAKIGDLFLDDKGDINPMLPKVSVSHLIELSAYASENGIEGVYELYKEGVLVDGMSTKKIRETLKDLSKNALTDSSTESSEDIESSENTESSGIFGPSEDSESSENTDSEYSTPVEQTDVSQLEINFDKQVVVGKIMNACELLDSLFSLLNKHEVETIGQSEHIDTIRAIAKQLL